MNIQARDVLLSHHVKPSVQRVAIMQYLLDHRTHPTVEDVYSGLCDAIPTLSRTTVYNTLRMFANANVAQLISIDDHRVCYDGDVSPHAHFLCDKCGKVFDFFDDDATMIARNKKSSKGFNIQHAQVYYKGLCPECNISLLDD